MTRTTRILERLSDALFALAEQCHHLTEGHMEVGSLVFSTKAREADLCVRAFELGREVAYRDCGVERPVAKAKPDRRLYLAPN